MKALFLALIILVSSLCPIFGFSWDCTSNDFVLACIVDYQAGVGFYDYCQCYLKGFENTIPEDFEVFECKEVGKVPKCFHNNRDSPEMECRCGNFIE